MQIVLNEMKTIRPWDELEKRHLGDSLEWVLSGAPLFRIQKPDVPPQHLVSYSVLVDTDQEKVLLTEHKNAGLWLPCGGHVEPGEHPKLSASRELGEELNIKPELIFEMPIFITQAVTVGKTAGHTDVSLWYVFKGKCSMPIIFDHQEFRSIKWFSFNEIPFQQSDPNMLRFIEKLKNALKNSKKSPELP